MTVVPHRVQVSRVLPASPAALYAAWTEPDRGRAQHEHHRDRVNPALITATVGHLREPFQQVRAQHRGVGKAWDHDRVRHGPTERSESGLGDGRMQQQRSSGGEKSVEGPLQLPELRCLPGRDTPKITEPSASDQILAASASSPA